MGIDGFRFDLAPVLGNTCQNGCFNFDKMDPNNALTHQSVIKMTFLLYVTTSGAIAGE
jgi:pullulanase/glycogen debranching enzyme